MMEKPIFTIGVPTHLATPHLMHEHAKSLEGQLVGYHLIMYTTQEEEFVFRLFSAKDIEETDMEKLKQLITGHLNK